MARFNRGHRGPLTRIAPPATVVELGTTVNATANATTVTSASFTPAVGSLLVAFCAMGNGAGTGSSVGAVTDSVSGSWARLAGNASTSGGVAEIWVCDAGDTPSAMTVTYDPGGAGASGLDLIVKWYNAVAVAAQTGPTATPAGGTSYTASITTTMPGSLVVGALGRATDAATPTVNAATTLLGSVNGSSGDTAAVFRVKTVTGVPGATTVGFTNVASGTNWFALVEILPVAVSPDLTGGSSDNAPADLADGAGAGFDAAAAVTVAAEQPAAVGAGQDAVGGTGALPDTPAGTGSAGDVAAAVTVNAGQPAATGTTSDAVTAAGVLAEQPTASGIANDAAVTTSTNAPAEQPAAVGVANAAVPSVGGSPPEATGTGTAFDAAISIRINVEQPAAAGAANAAVAGVGAAAETGNAWATRFEDDFTGISTGPVWADSVIHGQWYQTPSGNQTVQIVEQSATRYLKVSAEPIGGGAGTFAGLALSRDAFANWSTLAVEYITDTQHRTPAPNRWEVGWTFFNFTDNNHFYYVLLCPDGYWELGKEWTDGVTQFQDFLVIQTGTPPVTWPLGDRLRVEIDQVISGSSVTFTVRAKDITRGDVSFQTLVSGFTDDGTRPSGAANLSGQFGLYVEDSAARFATVEVNHPRLIQASITASSSAAGFAGQPSATGAAFDAAVVVTAGAEAPAAAGAGLDAVASAAVTAGQPTAAGAGFDAVAAVVASAEQPTAVGSAGDAAPAMTFAVGEPESAGTALDVVASAGALPGQPAATGTTSDAVTAAGAIAEQPTATGTANDATVSTATQVSAPAEQPAAVGTGFDAVPVITFSVEQPAATGAAGGATASPAALPDTPTSACTASDAATTVAVNAEQPTGAGSAVDATVTTSATASAPAESPSATGVSFDATVSLTVSAEQPTAAGASSDASPAVAPNVGAPTAAGTASDAGTGIVVNAETPVAAGSAWDAVAGHTDAPAGTAAGAGAAFDTTITVATAPAVSNAAGSAFDAAVDVAWAAEFAAAVGAAFDAATVSGSAIRPFVVLDGATTLSSMGEGSVLVVTGAVG